MKMMLEITFNVLLKLSLGFLVATGPRYTARLKFPHLQNQSSSIK